MLNFLSWLKDTGKDTYCRLSNDYTAIKDCSSGILVHLVKSEVFNKDKWRYEIIENVGANEKREPCSWRDVLNGYYEFSSTNELELVKRFNKSDKNRKLYKGFDFLPKLSSGLQVRNVCMIKILY
jgi:hypothetical protein